jgi:hypothetical protein
MMWRYFILIATILHLGFFACCRKDPLSPALVSLPAATQSGANTGGFALDGVNHRADSSVKSWNSNVNAYYYYPISIEHAPWDYSHMQIKLGCSSGWVLVLTTTFVGTIGPSFFGATLTNTAENPDASYTIVSSRPSSLIFTNTTGLVRAGSFDFFISNDKDTTDQKHVTDGRFDIMDLY